MKISVINRLYIGFTISFVIAALIGIVTFYTFSNQVADNQMVSHTYKVITLTENVQKLMVDMETGRRGFMATGQQRFLEPYTRSLSMVQPSVKELRVLLADNPAQIYRFNRLERHIEELLDYWKRQGDDVSKFTQQDIVRNTDQEKELMDRIRKDLDEITHQEKAVLSARQEVSSRSISIISYEVAIGSLLVEIIIIVLARIILREFKIRRRAEDALLQNLGQLEIANNIANETNWMLTGTAAINESLKGISSVRDRAEQLLDVMLRYLELPAGIVYLYNDEAGRLECAAASGIAEETCRSFDLGSGLPGFAAQQQQIQHIKNIPADYWQFSSGSGNALPGELLFVPLYMEDGLKGLLELASFSPIPQSHIDFLLTVNNNIAIGIHSSQTRERMMMLLSQVQEQREELVHQQEELRQTNEELTRQAEVLQASEEEMKVQEEELRQINAELEERNEAVEIARKALSLKAKELEVTGKYKSEFLANMSHELRTPLNSVLILAKLLAENKQSNLSDKQVEYARIIHNSGNDLLRLINDILDLSKIEAGKVDFNIESISIKDIQRDITSLLRVQLEEKGLQFNATVDADVPACIQTDKMRLEQVIKNLLANAVKFTPSKGSISLHFRRAQDAAELSGEVIAIDVTDTGIGIPQDKQRIIFEAFKQADGSTSRKYGGTGLGLSISKELVRKLGGYIHLQSQEGKGSTFTIFLPLVAAGASLPVAVPATPAAEEPAPVSLPAAQDVLLQDAVTDDRLQLQPGDRLMLIVEDDIDFATVLRDYAREKGYKTIVAISGDEGLYYAARYKPSAIILDMQLPVIDGKSVLKTLKNNDKLRDIPVHIISAADEVKSDTAGAIAYLHKPVAAADLENAFALIRGHIAQNLKKVLVLSGDNLTKDSLQRIMSERNVALECDYVSGEEAAVRKLEAQQYDCIIADIGNDAKENISLLEHLRPRTEQNKIPLIVYLDHDLSSKDEMDLKRLSDAIVRESSHSKGRLMDELELFLYKIQETQRKPLPYRDAVTDSDSILIGKKVLVADDDMRNVFALSTMLEEQQMEVVTAGDGKEALEQLQAHDDIDMVLMDVMMPEMDGYEAMRQIRKHPSLKRLPVIALTAKAMPGDQQKCMEAGASDYITKPVDSSRLFSLMRVWLSQ